MHVNNHALEMMGGLVMGVDVRPNARPLAQPNDRGRRRLRKLRPPIGTASSSSDEQSAPLRP